MSKFNDSDYERIIEDLIGDMDYSNLSVRGKISTIRQFSEILVRKILNIGSDKQLMLGCLTRDFKHELSYLDEDKKILLLGVVEKIRPIGNKATHTQHIGEFTEEDLEEVIDGLFDLYAFLFIDYFTKYPINLLTTPSVLRAFSLLPPIVRYKTLKYFYERTPNLQIANRYLLAIVKLYGKEYAREWLYSERKKLLSLPYPTDAEAQKYYEKDGVLIQRGGEYSLLVNLMLWKYSDVYSLLDDKIEASSILINEKGKLYSNFEEAKNHYLLNKIDLSKEEIRNQFDCTGLNELYELMDFVYIGRKARE